MTPTPEELDWECQFPAQAGVGELPIWQPSDNSLFWTDLYGPTLNQLDLGTGRNKSWALPDMTGGYGLLADHRGALVATMSGVYEVDFAGGEPRRRAEVPYDTEHFRFNDGRVDPDGRLWLGASRKPRSNQPEGSGRFWRLDPDGWSAPISGVTIANGLAFSPSGSVLYLADSTADLILAYDYDRGTGTPSSRRVWAHAPAGGFPDGGAVDVDGGYWSALFNGDLIVRFDAAGRLDRVLRSPVPQPTMVSFGGVGLATMFLTTARRFMPADELSAFPLAGAVFACRPGVSGIAEPYVDPVW